MRFLSLLWCFLLSYTAFAQSDLQKMNVKGKPKTLVMKEYDAKDEFGKPTKGKLSGTVTFQFNEAGNIKEQTRVASNGIIVWKAIPEYDASGKKVSQGMYAAGGNLIEKGTYEYDASGNLLKETLYNGDGSLQNRTDYKCDAKGNIIEQYTYHIKAGKKEPTWEKTTYNAEGLPVERVYSNAYAPDQQHKFTYKYDENGNVTYAKTVAFQPSTNTTKSSGEYFYTYQYDVDKNKTSQTSFAGEAKIVKGIIEFEYTY
jgi:hypothetical protein